ncbi:MAG: Ig-like domain-containing protein [Candidatus Rokuibacteriota bacterium]
MRRWVLVLGVGVALCAACSSADIPIRSADPVAALTIEPIDGTFQPSEAVILTAVPRDAHGQALAERVVSWTTAQASIAHVSPRGLVTALAPGSTRIVASSEGKTAATTITVVPLARSPLECGAPKPGWLWCDDFEQDRLPRYSDYGSRGSFVRAARVGYGGSMGMRAHFETGQVNAGFLHVRFGKVPAPDFRPVDAGREIYRDIYWRVYVRYAPWWIGGGGNKMSRAQSLASDDWAQAMIAHVWTPDEPIERLWIEPASAVGFRGRLLAEHYNDFKHLEWLGRTWSKTPLFDSQHIGRWYCIEARARLNDPGRSNGIFELWINDKSEARLTGLGWMGRLREYGINAVYLENYWNAGAPQPQDRDFDNFVISTARIGCR